MIHLTGDTHGRFERISAFCDKMQTCRDKWLDCIEERLEYTKWYCGHYHTEKKIHRLQIMYNDYAVLEADWQW